jgi:predicted O-methyltransferase YrrM
MSSQIEINSRLVKYLAANGYRSNALIDELVKETKNLGNIAKMQIAPEQGQLLQIIVKISNTTRCLEIGRFTGLSTLCMAKGLSENGKIISVDNSDEFLTLAKKYWERADIQNKIESVIGEGVEVMQSYIDRQYYFDLIFIDADKNNYLNYYELSLQLLLTNGLVIIDNMLWGGDVADLSNQDKQTETIHALNKKILKDDRVEFCLLPLSDGLSLIRKK